MDRFTSDNGSRRGFESSGRSSMSDCEYRGTSVSSSGRKMHRNVVRCPTPEPIVRRVVERAPTPEPDIIERVVVKPAPQTIVERIIERPATPEPRVVTREVIESPQPAIVRTRVVKVGSRSSSRYSSRGYIPSRNARVHSRYDDYFEDDVIDRHRSHSSYRSRPMSRYDDYVSRSSSRHSTHHGVLPMSRSQSFDVVHVPGEGPVGSRASTRPSSVYNGQPQVLQPSAPPMEGHVINQYGRSAMMGSVPVQQTPVMNTGMYPQVQRIYPNSGFLDSQPLGHQQFGYQQNSSRSQYPNLAAAAYGGFPYQAGGEPSKSYSPTSGMLMSPYPVQSQQHMQGNRIHMNPYAAQPNVINLPPVQLSYMDLQYLGIPYPSY